MSPKNLLKNLRLLLLIVLLNFFSQNVSAQQLAFPTAYGAGAYTTGGRGGIVVHVTNLNNSGPGSLREALQMTVPRTVVFDVSGVITLTSVLALGPNNGNLTIAGQTAPEGGITIDGNRIYMEDVPHVICRYIRFKGGRTISNDSATINGDVRNQIFDHCTFGFGTDEGGSWYGASDTDKYENVTIQRCLFGENSKGSIIGVNADDLNLSTPSTSITASFISNLIYNSRYRFPNITGKDARFDIINNVIWNAANRLTRGNGDYSLNHQGNYYNYNNSGLTDTRLNLHRYGYIPSIYTDGNKIYSAGEGASLTNSISAINADNTLMWKFFQNGGGYAYGDQLPTNYFTNTQHTLLGNPFQVLSADEAFIDVTNNVGVNARLNGDGSVSANFDTLDSQWIANVSNNIFAPLLSQDQYIVPPIPSVTRPSDYYLSNSHIPEDWFSTNVPPGQNHNDIAPSGYTWLEEYLNQVDTYQDIDVTGVDVSPETAEVQIPETVVLTATVLPDDATNKNGIWSSSDESIATVDENGVVTPISNGVVIITFTTSDGGFTDIAEITVFPEALQASAGDDQQICEGESIILTATSNNGTNYFWSTGATTEAIEVSPTETTTYSVVVSNDLGEEVTDDIIITVNPIPLANAGEDQVICEGESLTLTASGGTDYIWSNGETTASITVSPNVETTYTVEVISNNCSSTDAVTIGVNPSPGVTLNTDLSIYNGDSVTLTAGGADTYQWNNGETTNTIEVTPSETTTYTVTGFANGCHRTVEVTVTVLEPINANAGDDVTICSGNSVTLNATGGTSYSWNSGETVASIVVSPSETTTYTVTVTDELGSTDTDSVTVTVNETPTVTVSDDIIIMDGESLTLTSSGAQTYLWNTGETTDLINVSPTTTTTYTVTGYSNNCEATAQVTVTVIPELIANAGNDVTICNGESVTLNASGGMNYSWNTGDTVASPTFSPTVTTTYTVTVTDNFGNSDSDSITVTVNETPNVTVSENITIIEGESTSLAVLGADNYLWSTGETSSTITVSPMQTTTYIVEGTTATCSAQAQVTVTVEAIFQASAGTDERVCDDSTYEIVLSANQGDSYLWSTGETSQSIVVSPLSTTIYTVTVSQGEQEDTDDVTVYVDPSPNVTIVNGESVDILNGDFITLTASGANTYEWNNGATQPNVAVSPSTTTTYEVRGYIGECYDEKQVTVNVFQPVVANAGENVSICLDEIATLTASGGDEYVWNTGEMTQSIQVSPSETTQYTVTVFNAMDFDEASVIVGVDANCDSQPAEIGQESLDFMFDIFPNPASNLLNLKLSGMSLSSDVYIFDITGKLIMRTEISNEEGSPRTTRQIDISAMQSGIYLVKLMDQDREIIRKLIVE